MRRRWSRLVGLLVVIGGLTGSQLGASPAHAFSGVNGLGPTQVIYYWVEQSFWNTFYGGNVNTGPLYNSEHAWKTQDLTVSAQLWNDQTQGTLCNGAPGCLAYITDPRTGIQYGPAVGRDMWAQNLNNATDLALSSTECDNGVACAMIINPNVNYPWNTTDDVRSCCWYDLRSVLTHEMGHWLTGQSNHSTDIPATDSNATPPTNSDSYPVMWYQQPAGAYRRNVRQDDANAIKTNRNGNGINEVANPSFEYWQDLGGSLDPFASKFAGYSYYGSNNGGFNWARYSGGAFDQSWWLEFNGGGGSGESIYQDVHSWPDWQAGRSMQGSFWLRAGGGTPAGLALSTTLAVWALQPAATLMGAATCYPVGGGGWINCRTPRFTAPDGAHYWFRVQIYENTAYNIDADLGGLFICNPPFGGNLCS